MLDLKFYLLLANEYCLITKVVPKTLLKASRNQRVKHTLPIISHMHVKKHWIYMVTLSIQEFWAIRRTEVGQCKPPSKEGPKLISPACLLSCNSIQVLLAWYVFLDEQMIWVWLYLLFHTKNSPHNLKYLVHEYGLHFTSRRVRKAGESEKQKTLNYWHSAQYNLLPQLLANLPQPTGCTNTYYEISSHPPMDTAVIQTISQEGSVCYDLGASFRYLS